MSAIDLRFLPHIAPMSRDEFCERHPPYSLAIDGFVMERSGVVRGLTGPHAWLDHHQADEARYDLRATCSQVFVWLKMGLLEAFRQNGKIRLNVYVRDTDQDVALSWFLLNNHEEVVGKRNKRLERLIELVDRLDTTAGAFPVAEEDRSTLEQAAWIFEPYTSRRINGKLHKLGIDEGRATIFEIEKRIHLYLKKEGKRIKLDFNYQIIGGDTDWKMIRETGAQGRQGAVMDGAKAYIIHVETFTAQNGAERHRYTIARLSEMVDALPLPELYTHLNALEGCSPEDCWGKSSIVGGSPLLAGSKYSPKELDGIVKRFRKERAKQLAR